MLSQAVASGISIGPVSLVKSSWDDQPDRPLFCTASCCIKRCWPIDPLNIDNEFACFFRCHKQKTATSTVLISTQLTKHGSINMQEMIARITRNTVPLKHPYVSIQNIVDTIEQTWTNQNSDYQNPNLLPRQQSPSEIVASVTRNSTSSM